MYMEIGTSVLMRFRYIMSSKYDNDKCWDFGLILYIGLSSVIIQIEN